MKITFVSVGYSDGEAYGTPAHRAAREIQIFGLAREMSRMGHDVTIIRRWPNGQKKEEIEGVGMVNIAVPKLPDSFMDEIPSLLTFSRMARRELLRSPPDVFCTADRFSGFGPSDLHIPKVFIASTHDAFGHVKEYEMQRCAVNSVFFELKRRIEETVMRRSDATIALTPLVRDYLSVRGIKNVRVIPNAVELSEYCEGDEGNFILSAGRLVEHKGFQYLLDAYAGLGDRPERIIIIGRGPYESQLRSLIKTHGLEGRVELLPFLQRSEYCRMLATCRLFIFPSDYEAFGVVLIEAMASGKCVITSDIPGPGEIVTNGVDGLLMKKGDVGQLEECLRTALDDRSLRHRLGSEARKTVERSYTFPAAARAYLSLYEELLRR